MPTSVMDTAGNLLDRTDIAVQGFREGQRKVVSSSQDGLGRPESRADSRPGSAAQGCSQVLIL